jgi:hypothetical protein
MLTGRDGMIAFPFLAPDRFGKPKKEIDRSTGRFNFRHKSEEKEKQKGVFQ